MNPSRLTVLLLNALISGLLIVVYAIAFAPPGSPALGVVDLAELYRLKEKETAALLIKPGISESERSAALNRVSEFGHEVTRLIQALPQECRCLVLARGALIGSDQPWRDLTPELRRQLGL